ncbi:hypothetical protein ACIBCN_36625 [Nocardia sp. NPDC051052]|uniref:hypothetical protein n=1 Tax=Nocardia sp. NPDC051052 TaxID=3364322 RepID=UPI003792A742
MESGAGRETSEPSRAITGWTVGLICAAIVACGVIVSGLLHKPEPELTTQPVPVSTTPARPKATSSYVTPPVVFPVRIPGCDVVEPPGDGKTQGYVTSDKFGYDNPAFPWFSGPKAVAMSQALRAGLPDGVDIGFAPVRRSLFFQPIFDPTSESGEHLDAGGWTMADATLLRGGKSGDLMVSVRQSAAPIPPCVAGNLDERRHLADGTTVDVHDTWFEVDKVRTLNRTANAYLTDGTTVTTSAFDVGQDSGSHSGTVPLTVDELAALATAPGLSVTAAVPPGTPDVPESCGLGFDFGSGTGGKVDESVAHRLEAVLARIPLDGLTLDRPLGYLRPVSSRGGGLCQIVRITTPGKQSSLRIKITTGQSLPSEAPATIDSDGNRTTLRRLPDGTAVESRESRFSTTSNRPGAQPVPNIEHTVTVTRPTGSRVEIGSTAERPTEPLSFEQLESIALTPGLEVS